MEEKFLYSIRERSTGRLIGKSGGYTTTENMCLFQNPGPAKAIITRIRRASASGNLASYAVCDVNDLEVVKFKLVEV